MAEYSIIHSSIDGHLGCFHILAIVNNAAVNIEVHVSFWVSDFFFFTYISRHGITVQYSSVTQLCLTLCSPMDCSTPNLPVHHQLLEFTQTHVQKVGDAIQTSHLCHPLFLPSVFPSIRVFSNKSVLCTRWPKYWSFSFSISPSSEFSRLISFRIVVSPCCPRDSRVFFNTTVQKHQLLSAQLSL